MRIVNTTEILGMIEMVIETDNIQEQNFLKDKLQELNIKYDISGTDEVLAYVDPKQKIELETFISRY